MQTEDGFGDTTAHSALASNGEPGVREEEDSARRAPGARVEEGVSRQSPRNWRLRIRGVPGSIKARGEFPGTALSHKTADIRFYDNAWWFSICVEMAPRRLMGAEDLRVEFDLIDEFARVTRADGLCEAAAQPDSGLVEAGILPQAQVGANAVEAQERGPPGGGLGVRAGGETKVRSDGGLADSIKSECDRRFRRGSIRWRRQRSRVARIQAHAARQRREALHRWTTAIVSRAASLSVIAPRVSRIARTGRGDEERPGAQVEAIALLNRRVREQAPAAAVQMLTYKFREAGGTCEPVFREDHQIGVGRDLRSAAITARRAKRTANREKEKVNV